MKKLLFIFCFLYSVAALAQQYNNEWIDYNKTYFKFKVGSNGLYRIPQNVLAGISLANVDVSQFQLWRNGAEVPLYTSNQAGVLAAGGYIEFWGEANDGKPDQGLYRNSNDQINNSKSLFTDSAAYFLTLNPTGNNKRFVPTANNIPTGVTAEPYFVHTVGMYPNETIHLGPYVGAVSEAAISASYEVGEGWTSNEITENQTRSFTLTNLNPFTGAGAPAVQIGFNLVGNSPNNRTVQMLLNNTQVFNTALNQFNYAKLSASIPASTLNGGTETISVANISTVANNRIKIGSLEITYPRTFNFGGSNNFRFKLAAGSSGKYLEISGFSYTGIPVLYDITNGKRYEADVTNPSVIKIYVQPFAIAADLVLVSQAATNIKTVTGVEARTFINYGAAANQGNYLMITHNAILNASDGSQPVEAYRAYRTTPAGGGYSAKVYMIDQLIDQFAYGIKGSPLSVRNFLRFARGKFSVQPKAAFIIGKGVKYVSARLNEANPITSQLNLIPTFGEPASDILLAAEGSSSIPLTPIGRISVINGDELAIYLDKVKQYEAHLTPVSGVDASAWKKNVIHMVGANDQGLIDQLYGYLNRDKVIIEDTLYGAKVSDFVKSSTAGSDQISANRLKERLNNGVALLTYFGHSSTTNLAFNLENPENYSNFGKYPVFHMMGCNVGDIFILDQNRLSSYNTISEKYLLTKDRGSIGMMAGTSFGYVYPLQQYNAVLYKLLSNNAYSNTLGDLMQKAIQSSYMISGGENSTDLYIRAQNEEYTLNADPAIRLYQFDKPDYAIEDAMVSVTPSIVSVTEPYFTIKAQIANLGKATNNPVIIELKRTYPDLSVKIVRRDTLRNLHYTDSLIYQVELRDPLTDKGANKFSITIDPENMVDELFENNNALSKEIYIYEDDVKPVFPYNYAIINRQGVSLFASTGNPFAESRNYIMEMDTTATFNSLFKISQTKVSSGGLVEFTPGLNFKDSTVYYWRVSKLSESPSVQQLWNEASFTYISGLNTGFGQSHKYQQYGNNFHYMHVGKGGQLYFDSVAATIRVSNVITPTPVASGAIDVALFINGNVVQGGFIANTSAGSVNPQENSLRFYLVNNKVLKKVDNVDLGANGKYQSYRPVPMTGVSSQIINFFQFDISTTQSRQIVMKFLDSIPIGYYVCMTSNQIGTSVLPSVWQGDTAVLGKNISLYHKLKQIGFTSLDLINSIVPYVYIYQNGSPAPLAQMIGQTATEKLNVTVTVPESFDSGSMFSPVFTKSKNWTQFVFDGYSLESPSTDSVSFNVVGIDKNGSETTLIKDIPVSQKTVNLSSISAATYPALKVSMKSTDRENRSPYQLKYWHVYGTPVPEGAIAPNMYYSGKDTVEVGEPVNLGVAFKNVSNQPFDSVAVKLTIRDQNNIEKAIPVPKVKPLVAGDTIKLNVPLDTRSLTGINLVHLEFNPEGTTYQPEQFQFNNFISKNLYVRGDSLNPYMDVTFDGVRILNKDIVSSKPDILIRLTDDAKYLLLNSADLVKVQLRHPDGVLRDYKFDGDTLTLTPPGEGNNDKNTATISFKPHLLADGEYELVVSGKDQSGNQSGTINYRIAFEVLNKPMISNLLNYPNPFTSSTAFVFTLTGAEIPQNIRIQILTITGKIVREITKAELGPLRIGRNITQFKWDGTDQYGQKLANGVYLYRVLTNLNGKSLEKYKASGDNTDKYFNKGYGKMVLIR